jgi:hypothetical protein
MAAVKPIGKLYVTVESASVSDKESEQWTKALTASLKGMLLTLGRRGAALCLNATPWHKLRDTRHATVHLKPAVCRLLVFSAPSRSDDN